MSWIDISASQAAFGVFVGSSAGATIAVAPADLKLLVPDPGSPQHTPGYVALLNDASHKVVLLISSVAGYNVNAGHLGVVGAFGQITFEVAKQRTSGSTPES